MIALSKRKVNIVGIGSNFLSFKPFLAIYHHDCSHLDMVSVHSYISHLLQCIDQFRHISLIDIQITSNLT